MATLEELEDEDIMEFIHSKGSCLDAFKREYLDVEKEIDIVAARAMTKEKESIALLSDLNGIKEQVSFTRKNVDELVSAQESLKGTLDHISSKRASFVEKERSNKEEINVYNSYFEELKQALAVGSDWTPEQLEQKQALEKEREFLMSKYDNRVTQVNGLRADVDRLFSYVKELEENILTIENDTLDVEKQIRSHQQSSKDLIRNKDDEEKKVFDVRSKIVAVENEVFEKKRRVRNDDKLLNDLDTSLKEAKEKMEVSIKEYDNLFNLLQEMSGELERQKSHNEKIDVEVQEREKVLTEYAKEGEIHAKETAKINQLREVVASKCEQVETEKHNAEMKRDALNRQIQQLTNVDIISVRKTIESQEKQLASLKQELDLVRKRQTGSEKASRTMQDLLQANFNGKKNLMMEQKLLEEEVKHQKDHIRMLISEKERFEHDIEISNQQYYTALEELKLQELQVQELQKKITEDQSKLKHKQNLYEAIRSDRNLYSKQLIESQDEIVSLKRKFRTMNHQIDQLKDEISSKDHAIVKEHFLHHSVDKERELLKNELTKIKKQLQSSDSIIENQRVEILKLNRIIEEAEQERSRQRNELSSVLAERNLLTSQVIKRNFELTGLYDRIKIQRSNLKIGESQYNKTIDGIMKWKVKLRSLVSENNSTINGLLELENYRYRSIQLEKDILTEKSRSRALMDELEKPMNVHRWRILESSDPKRFEKISQIQSLQKQLIQKSDQVTELDLLIQEKEKVYVELKNVIARQPGPEIEEQMLVYQQTLKEKNKQLINMEEELRMYRQQVTTFKEEIETIEQDMIQLKKKWFKVKKSNTQLNFDKK